VVRKGRFSGILKLLVEFRSFITDLILAVVRLLKEDVDGLVVAAQKVLKSIKLWDKG